MKLKLDENLSRRCAELLLEAGHDVTTVHGQGISGYGDRQVIEVCQREARALVTLDVGFSNPLVFRPTDYGGIAVLRLPRRPTPAHLEDAVRTLVAALVQRSIQGRLWIVELGRIREYRPENDEDEQS